ncbi:unnamed protein product [Schistosoma curassoni]|uniref:Uncharacterized protein n=1 Tax=Schistosoma curassoni TaxID=6186 RepID=A0A183KCM4_9TREM|nr:unnamed protein product [Schistosoma curassoni]
MLELVHFFANHEVLYQRILFDNQQHVLLDVHKHPIGYDQIDLQLKHVLMHHLYLQNLLQRIHNPLQYDVSDKISN